MKSMELKVWVEGIQRIVCGVTEETTCQDVVYALAHATGRTGKFTLTERWRNNERLLAPHEHPLKVLLKWGEYSTDVQFILQHSAPASPFTPAERAVSEEERKASVSSPRRADNVGIVKGVPKAIIADEPKASKASSQSPKTSGELGIKLVSEGSGSRRTPPSYRDPPDPSQRTLPPYREPPPPLAHPKISPKMFKFDPHLNVTAKRSLMKEYENDVNVNESVLYSAQQYRDLVRLVNFQKDKLSAQQAELTKYDAEIMYWETKTKEQQHQMDTLVNDAVRVDAALKQIDEQLRSMGPVEEEMEITKQQDRTLKSELTLLRSKLANCETELLLCKNKIRLLLDEIQAERKLASRDADERASRERSLAADVERVQRQVERTRADAESAARQGDSLRHECALLESTIADKKRHVERLVRDMKEANLQSLTISPSEEMKSILDGEHDLEMCYRASFTKQGSTRKIVGSPRQLENAVPTSKNPHGVWV